MASKTLGRVACPIACGHTAAQVKIKTDKLEKTAYPYVHCAGCGVQLHTRSQEQAEYLLAATRPEKGAPTPAPAPPAPEQPTANTNPPAPQKTPPAPVKSAGFFDGLFGSAP